MHAKVRADFEHDLAAKVSINTSEDSPVISVVIASVNSPRLLEQALGALDLEPERTRMEIVVVERSGTGVRKFLETRDLPVKIVTVDEPLSIPRLRHAGAVCTTGRIVAFLEDHVTVEYGWTNAMLRAIEQYEAVAVGGAVENSKKGIVNAAAYYCEYTRYMHPVPEGVWHDLPGNNIAYRREALFEHLDVLDSGKWESWINQKLEADGARIASTNSAAVLHIKPFRFWHFLTQRFHFSRSFAGMRRVDQTRAQSLAYGFGSLALPPLLMLRIVREVIRKQRFGREFLAAAPVVGVFLMVGALGEMMGYLFGLGDSLERVE
jgi:hypothetical protein